MNNRKVEPHAPDYVLPKSQIKIVACLQPHGLVSEIAYEVVRLCCNKSIPRITHEHLTKAEREERDKCQACAAKQSAHKRWGTSPKPPEEAPVLEQPITDKPFGGSAVYWWAPPPSVLRGREFVK